MATQLEQAEAKLFGADGLAVSNFKLFPGTERQINPNKLAQQVNQVLAQLEEGDYELVEAED